MTDDAPERWLLLMVRLPAEPSRHRVAVWRELRRVGALSLGQGSWAAPDVPAFAEGIRRAIELAERGEGEVMVLEANGRGAQDATRLRARFTEDRQDEWSEFVDDCAKFDAEIDKKSARRSSPSVSWKKKSRAWNGCAAGTAS